MTNDLDVRREHLRLRPLRTIAFSLSGLALMLLAGSLARVLSGRSVPPLEPLPKWSAQEVAVLDFPGLAVLGGYLTAARPRNRYPWVLSVFDAATTTPRGHGLTNMARRAWGLDGVLEVASSPGRARP